MNKTLGLYLILFSLLLAGLSWWSHRLDPEGARLAASAGSAGAVLCAVWGLLAVLGSSRKSPAVVTLAALSYVMLSQAVTAWTSVPGAGVDGRGTAVLLTASLALSVGLLVKILHGVAPRAAPPGRPVLQGPSVSDDKPSPAGKLPPNDV